MRRRRIDPKEAERRARYHNPAKVAEIKAAVEAGKKVYWQNKSYRVVKDRVGQWLILCDNGSAIGLTWTDGETLNGLPEEFIIEEGETK